MFWGWFPALGCLRSVYEGQELWVPRFQKPHHNPRSRTAKAGPKSKNNDATGVVVVK